jgi:hypothetical protein
MEGDIFMFCEQWLKLKRVIEMDCETLNRCIEFQPDNERTRYRYEIFNKLLNDMNRLEKDIHTII